MSYKGDPQIEDGYTRIANELMEAVMRLPLPGGHIRMILALIRRTYGFNKKADRISYSQLATATGLHRTHVIRIMNELVEANIVIRGEGRPCQAVTWAVNKHYLQWKVSSSSEATSSTQANSTQATSSTQANSTQATRTSSTQATRTSSTQATHKRHKDNKDKDGADAPPSPKPPTPQQAMFEAICEVCVLDPATVAKGRIGKRASTLVKAGYTPEQVRAYYGKAGWWYQHDWRGRKGDPPKPEQIGETIKQAMSTDPPPERPSIRILPQQGNHWWEESA